jgi:hypothetical protein
MKTERHLKIISIIIAFSLLFLGLYNQQPILAETIRVCISLLIIIYFIIIWMRTKKFLHFIGSMLLPIWLLMLSNPGSITDYLFLIERETSLQEITQFIQSDPQYEKLTTYSLLDLDNSFPKAHDTPTTILSAAIPSIVEKWQKIPSPTLYKLLKKNHLTGFKVGHGSILFYINNHRQLRYYFEKSDFIYQGDEKIKPRWYHVNQFTTHRTKY